MAYSPAVKVFYSRGSISSTAADNPTNTSGPPLVNPSDCTPIVTTGGGSLYNQTQFGLTDSYRLLPAPMISIQPEIYYANDTPIGYTYIINLEGYATSVDLNEGIIPTGIADAFEKTLAAVQKVKNIFSFNNGVLTILEATNDPDAYDRVIMRASGCIIRDLNFEENENNWINYAKYRVSLEANEIGFVSCSGTGQTFGCYNNILQSLPTGIIDSDSPALVDMQKYKIRSFNDGWTFSINESAYHNYKLESDDSSEIYELNNNFLDIQYTISAEGKHYTNFKSDTEIYLNPSWEQAKNFCQDRLYKVVNRLNEDLLNIDDINQAQSLFAVRSGDQSAIFYKPNELDNLDNSTFGIYNENIVCETSEAAGTFSATYRAILKKKNTDPNDKIKSNCFTTISTSKQIQDDGKNRDISITVNGSIQGLVEGGIIKSSGVLSLPPSGKLFINNTTFPTSGKYEAALVQYNDIAGASGIRPSLAQALSITYASGFNMLTPCAPLLPGDVPTAASHMVTHDYINGGISFTTNYNSKKSCQYRSKFVNYTITVDDPVPRIAEYVIPGRRSGPIIQRVGVDTPRYITVSAEGYDHNSGCVDPKHVIEDICENGLVFPANSGFPLKMIFDDLSKIGMKLLENRYSYNRTDGSYSLVRKYLSYQYNQTPNAMGANNPGRFNPNDHEATGTY
jgi:hypothetical protein